MTKKNSTHKTPKTEYKNHETSRHNPKPIKKTTMPKKD